MKVLSCSMVTTLILIVRGTAPARRRHVGTNCFHLVSRDAQFLGLEIMALRQYLQTWVNGMIGRGSVSETKVAHSVIASGGRRFTGRRAFLKVTTS